VRFNARINMEAAVERDPDRTRQAILDAAEEIFALRGFDATTLHEIGDAAGVSRSTPAYFFGNKNALYETVLARVVQRAHLAMHGAHDRIDPLAPPEVAVATYVGALLDFLANDHAYVRLIQREALAGASRVATLFGPPVEDTLIALAPAAEKAGISPQRLLLDLFALCWYPFAHEHTLLPSLHMTPRDPSFLQEHKDHLVELICGLMRDDRYPVPRKKPPRRTPRIDSGAQKD
jgi:AcrR family transcriptional regulator